MKDKLKDILFGFVVAIFLAGGVWGGYRLYPAIHPCDDTLPDTILVYDTVEHHIPDTIPYYIPVHDSIKYRDQKWIDSIVQANKVDTAALMANYYALHYYDREWKDSLLSVNIKDVISQNKPVDNTFTYRLLKPQTVINNYNTFYSIYITVGADLPFKAIKHLNLNLDVRYVTEKWYFGVGYNGELNCPVIHGGATVWKLR